MKHKFWLGLLTSAALVTAALGLAACGGGETGGRGGGTSGTGGSGDDDPPSPPQHTHTFSDAWSSNDEFHWHDATCTDTDEKKDKTTHDYENGVCGTCKHAHENHNFANGACTVCGLLAPSKLRYEEVLGEDGETVTGYSVIGWDESVTDRTHLIIPDEYEGYPVVSIGVSAFDADPAGDGTTDDTLVSVHLTETVKELNNYAFYHCTGLAEINLENVESIKKGVFSGCTSLNGISFGDKIGQLGEQSFFNCTALERIALPASITSIGKYAFQKAGISELILAEGLDGFGYGSFSKCNSLTEVTIPASVETWDQYAFWSCESLQKVTFTAGAKSVGSYAFYQCPALDTVILSASVTKIDNGAFYGCSALGSIDLSSVCEIGERAFFTCDSLTQVSLSTDLTSVGKYAFAKKGSDASAPLEISFAGGIAEWLALGDAVLPGIMNDRYDPYSTGNFYVERKLTFAGEACEGEVHIPSGTARIPKNAFYGLKITSIHIPESVKTVAPFAFFHPDIGNSACSVYYEGTVEAYCAADDLSGLFSVADTAALYLNGTKLTGALTIPEGVTKIPRGAFFGLRDVTSLTLPSTLQEIGEQAFVNCGIATVQFNGTHEAWEKLNDATGLLYGTGTEDTDTDFYAVTVSWTDVSGPWAGVSENRKSAAYSRWGRLMW